MDRRQASAIGPFGLFLALSLVVGSISAMPYSTDCMKNPFAHGCRGISAKRSSLKALPIWSSGLESQNQPEARPPGTSLIDLISTHQTSQMRARQMGAVIEQLIDATNKLVNLNDWTELPPSSGGGANGKIDYSVGLAKRTDQGGQREAITRK